MVCCRSSFVAGHLSCKDEVCIKTLALAPRWAPPVGRHEVLGANDSVLLRMCQSKRPDLVQTIRWTRSLSLCAVRNSFKEVQMR